MVPPLSVNWTKMRLLTGSNAIPPEAVAKMPKVGVALAAIAVVRLLPRAEMHWPELGSV
jgi:hypothetical protein